MKHSVIYFLVTLAVFASTGNTFAQDKKDSKQDAVASAVESRNYTFKANTALPLRGRTVQLTSDYTLIVKKDSVVAYLPYFGRAYTAPIGSTRGGIDFTSTDFTYNARQTKKGGWEIDIKPKDKTDVQELSMSISANGYGTLHVTPRDRQAISFNGYVQR